MKKLKLTSLWLVCTILLFSCEPHLTEAVQLEELDNQSQFSSGPICDGLPIMKYTSLSEIQNAHRDLYNEYEITQDEDTLNQWEESLYFYSLRKKDEDMDNGIIPDDPNFDSWNYTSDIILETILNQDGMVIIDNYLYLWDDGCVIHRIPYNGCEDYSIMLNFSDFAKTYDASPGAQEKLSDFLNHYNITNINICDDNRFDFETISEEGIEVKNDEPENIEKGTKCGFQSFIKHEILSHDAATSTISIKLTANFVAPIGSDPLSAFYISNVSDFTSVKITGSSLLNFIPIDWNIEGAGYAYPAKWMILEIDYSNPSTFVPLLLVDLIGTVNPLSGDSCSDNDTLALSLDCPISISKEPIDAKNGKWKFTLEGLGSAQNYAISWDFGDNSPVQTITNNNSIIHTFPLPCYAMNFNVTASIEKINLCVSSAVTSLELYDTCKRTKMSEKFKGKVDGKKFKLKIKIKERWSLFGGGTKIIHKFRYRKNGTKNITPSGPIFEASGLTCLQQNINSHMPSVSQSGKKRLKQRFVSNNDYLIDLESPYSVNFSHSNGFSHTLTYIGMCSN